MTGPEQTFKERPWTPGPWKWSHGRHDNSELRAPDPYNGILLVKAWGGKQSDPDLIALAPEMAEAILRFVAEWPGLAPGVECDECSGEQGECRYCRLYEVAEKVRAIGNTDA